MTMPSNSMSVARTHDDDVSEAHEAAGMEATAQGVAADAHAAGVQMLDATLTQDRKNDQAADNKLDEAAAKDADGAVETAANDRSRTPIRLPPTRPTTASTSRRRKRRR
jgi:hypothetical protein